MVDAVEEKGKRRDCNELYQQFKRKEQPVSITFLEVSVGEMIEIRDCLIVGSVKSGKRDWWLIVDASVTNGRRDGCQ